MSRQLYIYPAVKRSVSIIGLIIAFMSLVCSLCLLLSSLPVNCATRIFTFEARIPAGYTASNLLLLAAPWLVITLLAGGGNPFLRICSWFGAILIPLSLLLIGYSAPLLKLIHYYEGRISGAPFNREGLSLLSSFNTTTVMQCVYLALSGLLAYRYTAGYATGQRRLFLAWIILSLAQIAVLPLISSEMAEPYFHALASLQEFMQSGFWFITAIFGFRLWKYAPMISSMPELNTDLPQNAPPRA